MKSRRLCGSLVRFRYSYFPAVIKIILFYGAKDYDQQFFDKLRPEYPDIEFIFIESNLYKETASLAAGYDGICAFVNADLSADVIEELRHQGIRLILMRCAGYNNVNLAKAKKCGI